MKSLNQILGDVDKNEVIKIYFGEGESYTGVVVGLNRRYFSLTGFGNTKKKPRYRVSLKNPTFDGKTVTGYDKFASER